MSKKIFKIISILSLIYANAESQPNRIQIGEQDIFLSGMNLAWVNFARDLTQFDEVRFTQALDDVAKYGGNTLRWWLHVNGKHSPQWSGNMVTGITGTELSSLEKGLNLAGERGIVISLCLWSFDMLQDNAGPENHARNKYLLENTTASQSYIYNALIPMVKSVEGHKAILCWEIFNEPEGMTNEFGWTPARTSMQYVQRFINLCAGAIHRAAPNEKVSNGSLSFNTISNVPAGPNVKNYYSDDELIASGNDSLGTLDFYMVHYYSWGGTAISPFHHPASYWQLDKPIVIAEFSANEPYPNMKSEEAYKNLFNGGYAGALAWTWTGHDGHGNVDDAAPGMVYLFENHTEDIVIDIGDTNRAPVVVGFIPDTVVSVNAGIIDDYYDLEKVFYDYEDSTGLVYSIESVSNSVIANVGINNNDYIVIEVTGNDFGYSDITVKATDSGNRSTTTSFNLSVTDPEKINLALNKPVEVSSEEDNMKIAEYINDGNLETRWSSVYQNDQWVIIDLESDYKINSIKLFWETAYTLTYNISGSSDKMNWTYLYSTTNGQGGNEEIAIGSSAARYIKFDLFTRATQWGHSLWEVEVYGTESTSLISQPWTTLKVYPNPNNGIIQIVVQNSDIQIERISLFNQQGKLMETDVMSATDNSIKIKSNQLPGGIYFCRIQTLAGDMITVKVMVIK